MNNYIVVNYDPFSMESQIIIVTNEKRETRFIDSDLNKMAENIIKLCDENQVFVVKIHAPFKITSTVNKFIKNENKNIEIEEI